MSNEFKHKAVELVDVYGKEESIKQVQETIDYCLAIDWLKAKGYWDGVLCEINKLK